MAVDNILQYNGRNSFRVTDIVWSYPYGVQSADHVTHSFQAYCDVWQTSGVRAKTKFIDANGDMLSEITHTFEVPTVFDLVEITVPVPAGAVMAMLAFMQGGRDWWVAEPKSEFGESATPYNVNYQGQLTFITPTGVYTGMITTGQIVVAGSVSNPDEKLDEWITTIHGGMINLSSTVTNKTTKLTNEGLYTGEVVADQVISGQLTGIKINNGSGTFSVDEAGKMTASNAIITGGSFKVNAPDNQTSMVEIKSGSDISKLSPYGLRIDVLGYDTRLEPMGLYLYKSGATGYLQYRNGVMALKAYDADLTMTLTQYLNVDENAILNRATVTGNMTVGGNFTTHGTKNRAVATKSHGTVLQNAMESPVPVFVDFGNAALDDQGVCIVEIEPIFGETIDLTKDYFVQITKHGQGDIWVDNKLNDRFVVRGTNGLAFSWEIKALQIDHDGIRLKQEDVA